MSIPFATEKPYGLSDGSITTDVSKWCADMDSLRSIQEKPLQKQAEVIARLDQSIVTQREKLNRMESRDLSKEDLLNQTELLNHFVNAQKFVEQRCIDHLEEAMRLYRSKK